MFGRALQAFPASFAVLGTLSVAPYLDVNNNNSQDPGEPTRPAVMGAMTHGSGRLVMSGDFGLWAQVPQPLTNNTLNWLVGVTANLCLAPASSPGDLTLAMSGDDIRLSWSAVTGADGYQVWRSQQDTYFTPGANCAAAPNCTVTAVTSFTDAGAAADPAVNTYYAVVAANGCGSAAATTSNLAALFRFELTPGQ